MYDVFPVLFLISMTGHVISVPQAWLHKLQPFNGEDSLIILNRFIENAWFLVLPVRKYTNAYISSLNYLASGSVCSKLIPTISESVIN